MVGLFGCLWTSGRKGVTEGVGSLVVFSLAQLLV